MRGSEWVNEFTDLLHLYHLALVEYKAKPNSETESDLLRAKRALIAFARSDGDVEVQDDHA